MATMTPNHDIPDPMPTVYPYNRVLDARKPRDMLSYLSTYHVIFVIDDSTSMIMSDNYSAWNDGRWCQVERSIGPIADFTFQHNLSSVDIGFMNYQRNRPTRAIQGQQQVLQAFKLGKPPQDLSTIRRTPTGDTLRFFLDEALQELNSKMGDPQAYRKISPTHIIVLTDGEADDDPRNIIRAARQQLKANKHNPNYISIEIVQIGKSSPTSRLAELATGEYGDMIAYTPSNGADITPEKLVRIMLEGNHPTVRRRLRDQGSGSL